MKISRNEKCPCESGKKYKNCCINKIKTNSLNIQSAFDILKQGLSNNSKLADGGKDWHVKEIKYLNGQSLLIEYYTDKEIPMDIKVEMGEIISFTVSFIDNDGTDFDLFDEIPKYFGVSAFNQSDEQLLYVMSPAEIAGKMAKGNPLEWLKNSHFEDTTGEFLLTNSKIKIATIEKALRKLIYSVLNDKYEQQWTDKINNQDYQKMFSMYKSATGDDCRSSFEILDYSFLPNLKDIIIRNFLDFQHFFTNSEEFKNNMNKLNKIRRDESHNREISHSTYKNLETLYDELLLNIVKVDDSIVPKYAIDNWHIQLFRIIDKMQRLIPQLEETDRGNTEKIFDSFRQYRQAVENAVDDLSNVLVPLSKRELNDELFELLQTLLETLTNMLHCGENLEIEKMQGYFVHYQKIIKSIKNYTTKYLYSEV